MKTSVLIVIVLACLIALAYKAMGCGTAHNLIC